MRPTQEIERAVKMRLYALHKRQVGAVFALFFISLFITTLIGVSGPSIIQTGELKSINQPKQMSGPYKLESNYLDKYHQRLWLTMKPITNVSDEFRQSINVTVSMNNPSASSNPQVYERQRTIHCQKQVSIEK
ncbi:unnamed protein product [Adineta ricciae]|uniref:TMEM181 GOLD domain-containing protein n=1 Tax=Adineta ricciae TaxID=249248 RepID=A0A814HQ50_ADIRI|nr:unnamed protein product [Adineta ricciae]CAF1013294.1 unnamed protein product [Adineta ricciae]